MTTEQLHLQQASMAWKSTPRQAASDFDRILSRGADVVGFTEIYEDLPALREVAKTHDYALFWETRTGKSETVLAVRSAIPVLKAGSVLVNKADPGKPPAGGHSARYATWVEVEWQGNTVFVVEAHWVTGRTPDRSRKRAAMSSVVAGLIHEHARGDAVGFFMGDTNDDDEPNDDGSVVYEPLEAGGLVTVWDELGVHPPTHGGKRGGTIDVIGSWTADVRVSAARAKVWPWLNSDHGQVSAWYDIAPRVVRPRPVHRCPTCGFEHSATP